MHTALVDAITPRLPDPFDRSPLLGALEGAGYGLAYLAAPSAIAVGAVTGLPMLAGAGVVGLYWGRRLSSGAAAAPVGRRRRR